MTYEEAEAACVKKGGHLVTITSEEELEFVKKLLNSAEREYYWIGMQREQVTTDFYWITGEKITLTNWESDEPNNNGDNEFYVQMKKSDGEWIDNWNNTQGGTFGYTSSGYICEWESKGKVQEQNLTYPGSVKVKSVKKASDTSATITWSKASSAQGYDVYMKVGDTGIYKKIASIKKKSTVKFTQENMVQGKTYYFIVRAYNKVLNEKTYGPLSEAKKFTLK